MACQLVVHRITQNIFIWTFLSILLCFIFIHSNLLYNLNFTTLKDKHTFTLARPMRCRVLYLMIKILWIVIYDQRSFVAFLIKIIQMIQMLNLLFIYVTLFSVWHLSRADYITALFPADTFMTRPKLTQTACRICGKSFASRQNAERHMKIHTGEKPFQCTICHKRFNQKTNLKTHMVTHCTIDM